eukprot:GDKK01076190.1.p1 GENE.GDKK01076190.1~~GDKK01076190.1.p1  ORF type:complete len:175 (-),score=43.79 GDKK01076190.1:236-760(-)
MGNKPTMTEVAYGQFFEACEDAAYPLTESNQEETAPFQGQNWVMKNEMVRQFFRAMETVNNSQLEPSNSSMSLASNSYNSFASLSSLSKDQSGGVTPADVFGAFQNVALNGSYGSSNSLANFDASTPEQRMQLPLIIQQMLRVFDEFMHNHDNTEEASRSPKDSSSSVEFPKFC